MANNVAVFNPMNLPTFARERKGQSELSKALAGGGGGGGFPHRISIKGGVWRLVASGKEVAALEERFLDVVVVNAAAKISRTWYAKKWAEGDNETSPPSCWSSDGDKPDANVSAKQSEACATCPQNVAGSGSGQMKACRHNQRLAVVLANDVEGDVMQVTLPAKSIFGKEEAGNFPLQAYARWLAAQNIEPNEVVTRMKFDTTAESPKVFFKTMRWLTDEEHAVALEKGKTTEAKEAVKLNITPSTNSGGTVASRNEEFEQVKKPSLPAPDEEPPAPAPKATKRAAKKVPETAPENVEPTVRKQTETPTLPARPALSSIVDAWDADD